jgi:hypothetical protein
MKGGSMPGMGCCNQQVHTMSSTTEQDKVRPQEANKPLSPYGMKQPRCLTCSLPVEWADWADCTRSSTWTVLLAVSNDQDPTKARTHARMHALHYSQHALHAHYSSADLLLFTHCLAGWAGDFRVGPR